MLPERSETMSSLVVDASALVDALIYGRAFSPLDTATLHAPALLDYEFLHATRRGVHVGAISASSAADGIDAFLQLRVKRHAAKPLLRAMWGHRHDISAYDASYLTLAQALGIPLATSDLRLARAARRWCDVVVPD